MSNSTDRKLCCHVIIDNDKQRFLTACDKYAIADDYYCFTHRDKFCDDEKEIGICSQCFDDEERLWTMTCCRRQYCASCLSLMTLNCYCKKATYASVQNPMYAVHNFDIMLNSLRPIFESDQLDISYFNQLQHIEDQKKIKKLETKFELLQNKCTSSEKLFENQKNQALKDMISSSTSPEWTQWLYFDSNPDIIKTIPRLKEWQENMIDRILYHQDILSDDDKQEDIEN